MASAEEKRGFLRNRLRSAFNTSNDLITGISSNISTRLSMFSAASNSSLNSDHSHHTPPGPSANETAIPEPEDPTTPPLALHELPSTPPPMMPPSPDDPLKNASMTDKIKVTNKKFNIQPINNVALSY